MGITINSKALSLDIVNSANTADLTLVPDHFIDKGWYLEISFKNDY
jgi:hypothetical protein